MYDIEIEDISFTISDLMYYNKDLEYTECLDIATRIQREVMYECLQ